MEQLSLFNEARQLLKHAEDTAFASMLSPTNRTELQEFAKKYKFIVKQLIESDASGMVSFKNESLPTWGVVCISPACDVMHLLYLTFMPCHGTNCGIIRIKDLIFEETSEMIDEYQSCKYKNGVAYMVIVNGAKVEIQKFLGHKAYAEKASPDWTFKNSLPSNPPTKSPDKPLNRSMPMPTQTKVEQPRNNTYSSPPSSTTSYSSSYSYKETWWSGFKDMMEALNDKIEDLGKWFYYNVYEAGEIGSNILVGGIIIFSVIGVISAWATEGFGMAILAAFIGCIVCAIFMGVGKFVLELCVEGIMYIFRYLFYNAWTLLASVVGIATIITLSVITSGNISSSYNSSEPQEYVVPVTQTYCCTANTVLNVRSAPNGDAKVIGTIKSGQYIEVYNIVDGYAKFEYGDGYGYANTKYLKILE